MATFELSASGDGRRPDPVQKLIIMSDDTVITKQIQDTHSPDGRVIDCDPLLLIIEEILYRAVPLGIQAAMQENSIPAGFTEGVLERLSYVVNRISSEMTYKCLTSGDAHDIVISLLQLLSNYPWEGKLVLLLAAFVLMYSEFWILIKFHESSKLASKIAILKQVPEVEKLKRQLDGLNNLIMLMLDLAKCIVGFYKLPAQKVDLPELSGAVDTISAAIYWTARGIVFCAVYTSQLTAANYEDPTLNWGTLEKELSALADKIRSSNENLQKQLTDCYQIIEEKKENDAYEQLVRLTEMAHIDNLKVLRALISGDNDEPPLIDGTTKRTANLDLLRRKYVLFLISGLFDASTSFDLNVLCQIYMEAKAYSGIRNDFELVWMPIVDSLQLQTEVTKQKLEICQGYVPWYSVRQPSFISKPVKRFIKEKFHYRNRQILVVMDPCGKVSSLNALHMMWIWGTAGFPFTKTREQALWQEETWGLELLVNGIDTNLIQWIRSGSYIILYGGFDLQEISDFTVTARRIGRQLNITLEMVYVGTTAKSTLQELRPLINDIKNQRLSNCWEEVMMWFFWTRVGSMLLSKVQLEANDEQDPVMQELEKLLMYDGMGTWALFSKGSDVMLTGRGPALLHLLHKFDEWKANVLRRDFLIELKEQYNRLPAADDHPCCHLEFDHTAGRTPESMICPECHRSMEQLVVFTCCHEH
ncbi:protein SIEVE ELEMENT OCCLUSION B [Sesamum angolense]|uniref:Protein SIEVE ELEMENT OCCLUSION B n=1 Tax=Sesamum angolense TaxID=2727404 RepID=A0AAE1WD93_9LAMI|nr:protein SIEVE ELEMENT OCCLUSION B [Sesamum angolense]